MGALLVDDDMIPDLIVSSTSCRTRETTERLVAAAGYRGPVRYKEELYLAGPKQLLEVIAAQAATRMAVMLVGHNPGLEELLLALTKCDETLPTASLTRIALPIRRWSDLKKSTAGKLVKIWRPKELE
jgi:phosphohistidine phosphatase